MDIAIYTGLVPCAVALYNRHSLHRAQLFFGADILVSTFMGILSVLLAKRGIHNQFIYPILAVADGVLMGLFFAALAKNSQLKRVIWGSFGGYVCVALFIGLGYITLPNDLELFTFLDFTVAGLSLFFLARLIRRSQHLTRKPLFWILLALFLSSLYDIVLTQLGTLLAHYGGSRWKDLFWLQISPLVTMIKLAVITYGFYLTRFQLVKSEKLPQFTI